MSWVLLILILLLAMPMLAGVALILLFLASPKGRPWRRALAWLTGLSLMLLVGLFWLRLSMHDRMPMRASRPINTSGQGAGIYDPASVKAMDEIVDYYNGVSSQKETKTAAAPTSSVKTPDKIAKQAEADPTAILAARAAGIIEVVGHALGRALAEQAEQKEPTVAKTSQAKPTAATRSVEAPPANAPPAKTPPAWVHKRPKMVGDAYQMSIMVGPWKTRQECDAELPKKLQKALDDYVDACQPGVRRVVLPADYLRKHLVKEQWEEDIESETASIGVMKQLHVLLRFDSEVRERVTSENERAVIAGRLRDAGLILGAVFWLIGVSYGYLRIDMATGGIYRGRLRFAAGLAILGPLAAVLAVVS